MLYDITVIAQATAEQRPNWLIGGMPIILLVVMMFFLFRSQKKQANQRKEMLSRLKSGDEVVTNGGIKGTITKVKDKSYLVKIADKVEIEVVQTGVGALIGDKTNE
jgi:preprotein translocase subunit YajC